MLGENMREQRELHAAISLSCIESTNPSRCEQQIGLSSLLQRAEFSPPNPQIQMNSAHIKASDCGNAVCLHLVIQVCEGSAITEIHVLRCNTLKLSKYILVHCNTLYFIAVLCKTQFRKIKCAVIL